MGKSEVAAGLACLAITCGLGAFITLAIWPGWLMLNNVMMEVPCNVTALGTNGETFSQCNCVTVTVFDLKGGPSATDLPAYINGIYPGNTLGWVQNQQDMNGNALCYLNTCSSTLSGQKAPYYIGDTSSYCTLPLQHTYSAVYLNYTYASWVLWSFVTFAGTAVLCILGIVFICFMR